MSASPRMLTLLCKATLSWLCRDLLYLDLALESAACTLLESTMADIKDAASDPEQLTTLLQLQSVSLEHCCMAFASNQELVLCLSDLQACPCTPRVCTILITAGCTSGPMPVSALCFIPAAFSRMCKHDWPIPVGRTGRL